MLDILIRGGEVVTPQGCGVYDVGISGEKIVAVDKAGALSADENARIIDADGKIVMPGGIDPHVHCSWHIPAIEGVPAQLTAPPAQVSRAALYGGTTTMIDFAAWEEEETFEQTISRRDEDWRGRCHCDYAYHLMLRGGMPLELIDAIPEVIQAGYPTIKIFTTDITPSRRGRMVDFGYMWEVFQVMARSGGLGVIHAEDNDLVMHMYGRLFQEGRTGFENMAEVHSVLSEDLSFRRVLRLAENVEGTALYMMHISAATGVAAVEEARAKKLPIYGETLHQYMLYNQDDYRRPNGQIYHTYPSLKTEADQASLWQATQDGTIHCIATDELCCRLSVKVQGRRIDDTTGGNSGVEPRLAVMYQEMVTARGYSLSQYVDLVSSNAAKIMGLYPRKGAIAPGSDADITLLDPEEARVVRNEDLHESDYTPWEGKQVSAWPVLTILRGKIVVENGNFFAEEADGQYLSRRISEDVLGGTAL
jgi:dihydropyrimidinase